MHYTEAAVPDIVPHNPSSMIDIPWYGSRCSTVSEILPRDSQKNRNSLVTYLITSQPIPREKTPGGQNVAPEYLDTAIKVPVD